VDNRTLDAVAAQRVVVPPPGRRILAFCALADKYAVDAMFDDLPADASKLVIDMSA
jgi:hypothetical protein